MQSFWGLQISSNNSPTLAILGGANGINNQAIAPIIGFTITFPTVTAGIAFTFTVTALTTGNVTFVGYTGTVSFGTGDPSGEVVLPANSTLTSGVGVFSATLFTPGSQQLSATDVKTSTVSAPSTNVLYPLLAYFTAANNTRLGAYTPDNGPIGTEQLGTWEIETNTAVAYGSNPGGPGWLVTWNVSLYNVTIAVTINYTSFAGGTPGICFRYSDTNNFWLCAVNANTNTIALYERNAGTFTSRASATWSGGTFATNTNYVIEAQLSGANITFYVNSVSQYTYGTLNTTNPTATNHGLRFNAIDVVSFDALTVYPT